MDHMKAGGLAGLLGPPPKAPRGRKKIKAENSTGPLLVVPYPILADQGCVTIAPKEGKTYRLDTRSCYYCCEASQRQFKFNCGLQRINRHLLETSEVLSKLYMTEMCFCLSADKMHDSLLPCYSILVFHENQEFSEAVSHVII